MRVCALAGERVEKFAVNYSGVLERPQDGLGRAGGVFGGDVAGDPQMRFQGLEKAAGGAVNWRGSGVPVGFAGTPLFDNV
jgi:hypothetical protein